MAKSKSTTPAATPKPPAAPTSGDPTPRLAELRKQINHHSHLYYVEARPQISDAEFDAMLDELTALEKQHPHLITPDSPTQRVGGALVGGFKEVTHRVPMLSIDKATTAEELRDFDTKLRKAAGNATVRYTVEPKIDGAAVSLTYRNGLLEVGATRGTGEKGDDITHNVKTIASVPLRLRTDKPPALFEARGEVFMTKADFAKLNETLPETDRYANPRNLTAGTLKLLDPKACAARKLQVYTYTVGAVEGLELKTQTQALETLRQFGFPVNPEEKLFDKIEDVIALCRAFEEKRNSLPYEIDGMVVKLDDLELRKQLGATSKHVRWAIAYKFAAEQGITKVLDIVIHVGKYGEQTPVATLAPVRLAGTTVQYSTLHSASKVVEKDVRIGDTVVMVKRGDIIPHVEYVVKEARTGTEQPFVFPKECPVCGSPTKLNESGVHYLCTGVDTCPAQLARRVEKYGQRERMDIAGLGRETAEALIDSGVVKGVADLYKLTREKLQSVEGLGSKSAENLLAGIEASKTRGLGRLLAALSIPNISETFGPVLAKTYPSLDQILAATTEDLARIEGFGPKRAESVYKYFHCPAGEQLVTDLRAAGVKLTEDVMVSTCPQIFAGKTIVVTGTLKNYDRKGIDDRIAELGGKAGSSVSKKTDYVIVGTDPGSKYSKALSLGVPILSEDEFEAKVKEMSANAPPPPVVAVPTPATVSVAPVTVAPVGALAGKTVVVAGTLEKYDRTGVERLIASQGGKVGKSVTKETALVVAGEDAGIKLGLAKTLGVRVVSESAFAELLQGVPAKVEAVPQAVPPAPTPAEAPAVGGVLTGKTVVVTGTLTRYDRKGITALIERLGGKPGTSVTKTTDLVVVGADAGSKLEKARSLGIKILSESEFEQMIGA